MHLGFYTGPPKKVACVGLSPACLTTVWPLGRSGPAWFGSVPGQASQGGAAGFDGGFASRCFTLTVGVHDACSRCFEVAVFRGVQLLTEVGFGKYNGGSATAVVQQL